MKYILAMILFINVPLLAQSSGSDTLWIEPFLSSLRTVINNAEQVDFVVLGTTYANVVTDLPNGVSIVRSTSDVETYAINDHRRYYYVELTSFKMDSWGLVLEWTNVSITYNPKTYKKYSTTHVNYSFVYNYDGKKWSIGPNSITRVNHSHQDEDN